MKKIMSEIPDLTKLYIENKERFLRTTLIKMEVKESSHPLISFEYEVNLERKDKFPHDNIFLHFYLETSPNYHGHRLNIYYKDHTNSIIKIAGRTFDDIEHAKDIADELISICENVKQTLPGGHWKEIDRTDSSTLNISDENHLERKYPAYTKNLSEFICLYKDFYLLIRNKGEFIIPKERVTSSMYLSSYWRLIE